MINNIEFKILEKKSDIDDIAQECSAYLKTKQFMADRIYQQQEEIQLLKQQIFSLASANSQLGKIVQNFENEILILREQLLNHENKIKNEKLNNRNKTQNYQLIEKNNSNMDTCSQILERKIKNSIKNISINKKNTEENNKFNLSDDDPLIKSEVLPEASVDKKNESFSEFEHMNYTSSNNSQTNDQEEEGANLNNDVFVKIASFPQNSKVTDKDEVICTNYRNERNSKKDKDENLRILLAENDEIEVKSLANNNINSPKKDKNCDLDNNLKNFNVNECKNNDYNYNHNQINNLNLSLHSYCFEINKDKNFDGEKLQILNNEIIEKTIENNKLRTDKFILMSELNEILTSLTRIDLDKLNEFYLKNISKNNLAKYLMPTAKGIKFNIISCQNNLAKIIKSDFLKNEEIEKLNKNLAKHENLFKGENKKGKKKVKQYAPNYNLSPIRNFSKIHKVQFIEQSKNQILQNHNQFLINKEINNNFKNKNRKNFLEKNFNVNVNILYELFSKHEQEFDSLLEKKLMKFNKSNFYSNSYLQSSNEPHNNYDVGFKRNHGNMNKVNQCSFSKQDNYSP